MSKLIPLKAETEKAV